MKQTNSFSPVSLVLSLILLAGCSSSTFLIGKDGITGYFGRKDSYFDRLLCHKGELRPILDDAGLGEDIKKEFARYVCSDEKSYNKVVSLYLFLSPDEKKSLKNSFIKHGYDVNHMNC